MIAKFNWNWRLLVGVFLVCGCSQTPPAQSQQEAKQSGNPTTNQEKDRNMETATFGNGCFWCTEAVFERVKGIQSVTSGYCGGTVDNPTYQQVCTGYTGHAEVVQIVFDPTVVSYEKLLEIFWASHNPTTLNAQGPDHGTQYRSAVFYHSDKQKEQAEFYKKKLEDSKIFDKPIVTEIAAFTEFFPAEDYHQEYFSKNPSDRYCQINASPKIKKIEKLFSDVLKEKSEK